MRWTLGSQCAKYVCFQRHICTFAQCFAVTLKCTFVQTIRTGAGIGNLAKNRDVTKSASSNNGNLLCGSTFVEQIAEHRCWILAKKHYSTESLKNYIVQTLVVSVPTTNIRGQHKQWPPCQGQVYPIGPGTGTGAGLPNCSSFDLKLGSRCLAPAARQNPS